MEKEKFNKVKYVNEYTNTHYTKFTFRVRNGDTDILEKLKSVGSVNGYITELIRRDLNEEK